MHEHTIQILVSILALYPPRPLVFSLEAVASAQQPATSLSITTALFSPKPNSEWLIALQFHIVSPGSELLIAIYKVPQKLIWTITELHKHIKK